MKNLISNEVCVLAYRLCGNVRGLGEAIRCQGNYGVVLVDHDTAPHLSSIFDEVIPVAEPLSESALLRAFQQRFQRQRPLHILCSSDRLGIAYCNVLLSLGEFRRAESLANCYLKSKMRECIRCAGLDRTEAYLLDEDDTLVVSLLRSLEEGHRRIVKPVFGTGSELVSPPLTKAEDMIAWYRRIMAYRTAPSVTARWLGIDWTKKVMVEDYIAGTEFTVDGVVDDTRVAVYGIIEKEFAHDKNTAGLYGEGANFSPPLVPPSKTTQMADFVRRSVKSLGLKRTAFHAELRWADDTNSPRLLEVNPRLGGGTTSHIIQQQYRRDLPLGWLEVLDGQCASDTNVSGGSQVCGDVPLILTRGGIYQGYRNELPRSLHDKVTIVETMLPGTTADPYLREAYFGFAFLKASSHKDFFEVAQSIRANVTARVT